MYNVHKDYVQRKPGALERAMLSIEGRKQKPLWTIADVQQLFASSFPDITYQRARNMMRQPPLVYYYHKVGGSPVVSREGLLEYVRELDSPRGYADISHIRTERKAS